MMTTTKESLKFLIFITVGKIGIINHFIFYEASVNDSEIKEFT
jgi:hypothetical protein